MRRKAHHLMWPGKPYVAERPPPALFQREGSLRQVPRGVAQYMPSNHYGSMRLPNRPQIGMGASRQLQPAAKQPAPNAVRVNVPVRSPDAAREPYKPSVKPAAQYAMQVRQPYAAGVRYEPAKPVKDAVQRFERK
jgi:hypothetical protein